MALTALEIADALTTARGGVIPKNYAERLLIPEHRLLIASDVHVPYHDEQLVAEFIERASREKYDAIVWLGDLMDNPTFSHWDREDLHTTFENELTQVEYIIRLAAKAVKKQYWSIGNHETRWMRRLSYQARMEHLAKIAGLGDLLASGKLVVSDNPSLDAEYSSWMLTHPHEYGATPLVVPGKLADKYQQNVISAHAHHWGQGMSPSGEYLVVESGCLLEPDYVAYINNQVTSHRRWVKGYVALDFGEVTLHR